MCCMRGAILAGSNFVCAELLSMHSASVVLVLAPELTFRMHRKHNRMLGFEDYTLWNASSGHIAESCAHCARQHCNESCLVCAGASV